MSEIRNAVIKSTKLGKEDHGVMTFMIHLEYDCAGQGFGGYVLGGEFGIAAIAGVLKIAGVSNWEDLRGRPVRADATNNKVCRLGHYLKDEWLDLEELAQEFQP